MSAGDQDAPIESEDHRLIVVGVSNEHPAVLDYAAAEARRAACALRVVHAYTVPPSAMASIYGLDVPGSFRAAGQEVVDEALHHLKDHDPDVPVDQLLRRGLAPAVLQSETEVARLLVIGPDESAPWYFSMFEGHIARRMVEHAPCPVTVVPDSWEPCHDSRPVAVMIDGESVAHGPLAYAFATAEARGVELQVVHLDAGPAPDWHSEWPSVRRVADAWFEAHPSVRGGTHIVRGDVQARTLELTADAGLLVLGRPHERMAASRLVDSLAQDVIAGSGCPVAVVPAGYRG